MPNFPKTLKLGTRKSALALIQAQNIASSLKKKYPEISVQMVTIQTSGDCYKGQRVADAGGKGLFVKEIEEALMKGDIDFAVHSLKDLPGFLPKDLMLACFPSREDPRDCFVSQKFRKFEELPQGAIIGTGSPRRQAQVLSLRPDCVVEPIRGNVDTRLRKLSEENYDALILAAAGLKRLKRESVIQHYFAPDFLIPAVGQGVLGIEIRKKDLKLAEILKEALEDAVTAIAARAERAFLQTMGGDCYTPLAGYAEVEKDWVKMTGWYATPGGKKVIRLEKSGQANEPEKLGTALAKEILNEIASHKTA